MVFATLFLLNAVANFVLGVVLSALLGPAEFGRYATVALGAQTLAAALLDWLRLSSIRFSVGHVDREATAASLDAGFLAMIAITVGGAAAMFAAGMDFGLGAWLLALTPFMAIANARSDYCAALMRARSGVRLLRARRNAPLPDVHHRDRRRRRDAFRRSGGRGARGDHPCFGRRAWTGDTH